MKSFMKNFPFLLTSELGSIYKSVNFRGVKLIIICLGFAEYS